MHKIGQSGEFLGRHIGPLLKAGLHLMKHVLKPLPKIVLIPLGLTAAASVTDAANKNKVFGSSMTKLIIPNEKMDDIIKIIKSLQESGLLEKSVSEAIENEAKDQKGRFFGMLLGTLGGSLLRNLLTGKGLMRAGERTIRVGESTIRSDQDFNAGASFN